jgi:hypothetical protein
VLVSSFLVISAFTFYMDWLGLWVSKQEMRVQVERAKIRMLEWNKQSGNRVP